MDENYGMLKKGLIILAIPFVIQLAFLAILLKSQVDNAEQQEIAIHTKDVIAEIESLSRRLVTLRANLLGLAYSGDAAANPYDSVLAEVRGHLNELRRLVSDNKVQAARAEALAGPTLEFTDWTGESYGLIRSDRRDEGMARIVTQAGKKKLDAIQAELATFRREEEWLDRLRRGDLERSTARLIRSIILGSVGTMALAAALVVVYSRGFARRIKALMENARKLAEGKAPSAPIGGRDEIGQLSLVFDTMAKSLEERDRENETFIFSVSHDLRSPLVNLQGFSRELSMAAADLKATLATLDIPEAPRARLARTIDGDIRDAVHYIQTAVTRLSAIIDSLLRLSRAGRVEYRMEALDMNILVNRVVAAQRVSTSEKGATIAVGELPPAWGDPTAVDQVISNLLTNAVKYLDPARPGRIEVGAEQSAGDGAASVTYHVRDNGLGIAAAHQPKLFVAFQRLHPGVAQGEGVGLALARRMVERHSGKIWAESQPGVGTTFFVTLPATPPLDREPKTGASP